MPSSVLPESIPDRSRLTRPEVGLLLKLHEAGKTQTEIAHTIGCSQSVVSRWLSELADTRIEAKHVLHNGAQKLAKLVISEATEDQSLDMLERLEVVAPRQQQGGVGGVNILIGMPGSPAGPDPFPLGNIISSYRTQTETAALIGQQVTDTGQKQIEAKVTGETDAT